jgi:hypothetical protein
MHCFVFKKINTKAGVDEDRSLLTLVQIHSPTSKLEHP